MKRRLASEAGPRSREHPCVPDCLRTEPVRPGCTGWCLPGRRFHVFAGACAGQRASSVFRRRGKPSLQDGRNSAPNEVISRQGIGALNRTKISSDSGATPSIPRIRSPTRSGHASAGTMLTTSLSSESGPLRGWKDTSSHALRDAKPPASCARRTYRASMVTKTPLHTSATVRWGKCTGLRGQLPVGPDPLARRHNAPM